jgi:hypothetical protein
MNSGWSEALQKDSYVNLCHTMVAILNFWFTQNTFCWTLSSDHIYTTQFIYFWDKTFAHANMVSKKLIKIMSCSCGHLEFQSTTDW